MTVGKNKRLMRGKKGGKKKIVDPFTRKDWYDVKAPAIFNKPVCGKTPINRTAGTKIASECMKGRVFEVNLADLQDDEDQGYRKIKLVCEEVQGKTVLTNFHGMDFTRDRLCALIRKWQTLIEASVDVKTTDGYTLRVFCIAFTKHQKGQVKKTAYAQSSKIRAIREKMVSIMTKEVSETDLAGCVKKFLPEKIGKNIEKACFGIFPLQNVFIRKVKILKKPKFDLVKLMEAHNDTDADGGVKIKKAEEGNVETLDGHGGRL
jgi:small subunit ribosomal protein S3Ae